MNIKDFSNLSKKQMIQEYEKLCNYTIKLFAENSVLKARLEEVNGINELLKEKINKAKILKRK